MDEKNYIRMEARIGVTFKNSDLVLTDSTFVNMISLSVGGFSFDCKNSEGEITALPFDFDVFTITVSEDGIIEYCGGRGLMFNDYSISGVYDQNIKDSGFILSDITAETLARTTQINEFFIDASDENDGELDMSSVELLDVYFVAANGDNFNVSKEVLAEFNANSLGRV